jgi:hypothetical protein
LMKIHSRFCKFYCPWTPALAGVTLNAS